MDRYLVTKNWIQVTHAKKSETIQVLDNEQDALKLARELNAQANDKHHMIWYDVVRLDDTNEY